VSATGKADGRWLFGAVPDLLLGCGLGYLLVLALQGGMGVQWLAAWVPAGLLVMTASIPHYGATLLRVYESAEDRRKYVLFAVHVTVAVAILFAVGLRNALVGSLLLTLYLTWSPWHYSGQNYGVLLMLLRRRGVEISPAAKRWIYASFLLSFGLTVLAVHGMERGGVYAPGSYQGTAFRLMPLGIPGSVTALLLPAVAVAYGASLLVASALLLRKASARALLPGALILVTQAAWFVIPVVLRASGVGADAAAGVYTAYAFIWIAAAHAVQYLWVSAYYARASGAARALLPYLGKTVLAGYAVWVLPALIFAPGLLGRLPYESGLAVLVAACVNLHHFILDGAIWKLRDGRVARFLLRPAESSGASRSQPDGSLRPAPIGAARRRFRPLPVLVWGSGVLALVVSAVSFVEGDLGRQRALEAEDPVRLQRIVERLSWIGRDGPRVRQELAELLARSGDMAGARRELRRSVELFPNPWAWLSLGSLAELEGDWEAAQEAYQAALELREDHVHALYRSGVAWLHLGEPAKARDLLERASRLAPDHAEVQRSLGQAIQETAPASSPRGG
jgi:hypothetical protein